MQNESTELKYDKELERLMNLSPDDIVDIPNNIDDIDIREEDLLNTITSPDYGFNENDLKDLLPVINKYRTTKEVKFSDLPLSVKRFISAQCAAAQNFSKEAKNVFTEMLISNIIMESGIDKIKLDVKEAIEKEFDLNKLSKEVASESIKNSNDNYSTRLLEAAKKEREKGNEKGARLAEEINKAYIDSYELKGLKDNLHIKIKSIELYKFERVCDEFDFKYKNQNYYEIRSIVEMYLALMDIFKNQYTEYVYKKLIIVLSKYCKNMKSYNIVDHTFMRNVIANTIMISKLNGDIEEIDTLATLKESLKYCLDELSK